MKREENKAVTVFLKLNGNSCNMHCKYCYSHVSAEDKTEKYRPASIDEAEEYLAQFRDYSHVFIVFHGGEPLLNGVEYTDKILGFIKKSFKNTVNVQFQTNASLINDKWLELFKKYRQFISVSVSLDPPCTKDMRIYPVGMNYEDIYRNILKCKAVVENVGVVSVIHRHNRASFTDFVDRLVRDGIKSLTINKYRLSEAPQNNDAYISEAEYTDTLIALMRYWLNNKLYRSISIQPVLALLSKSDCKLCIYMANENKCSCFKTFFNKDKHTDFCDHVGMGEAPKLDEKCRGCDIYAKCGGGCLLEYKDESYCEARHRLMEFTEGVKNGYKRY